jgi:starch-binding outer membrane protein, SusD/RagB family
LATQITELIQPQLKLLFKVKTKMKIILFLLILPILFFTQCKKLGDIEDLNDPDSKRVENTPSDLESLAKSLYLNYWKSTRAIKTEAGINPSIDITALVAADQFTASWRNFGWLASSLEPREAWDNSITAQNDQVTENFYYAAYSVIENANKVIKKITIDKINLGTKGKYNTMYLALAYLVKGAEFGNLSLVFDKAFYVDETTTDFESLKPLDYEMLTSKAIEMLNIAIKISDTASFSLPASVFNLNNDISNSQLKQIAHSYIARFMVLSSRTKSDNSHNDWNTILDHANKGITFDFGSTYDGLPYDGGGGTWYDLNLYYLTLRGWARVDNRIVNLMDPAYPKRYPSSGKPPKVHSSLKAGQASSNDSRLNTDFEYLSSVNFEEDRGTYHYSNYRYKRFDALISNPGTGLLYEIRQYENELYKAEAYAMLKNYTAALNILNNSANPRIKRGKLTAISSTLKDDILDAIYYERDIELMAQGFMLGFCDMRRRDMLQYGTPLHYPIPGRELQTLNMPYYTFGGTSVAGDGNTSAGGWFK